MNWLLFHGYKQSHLPLEFDTGSFLFAMNPVWIWAAPEDNIIPCTLCTDAAGHIIIMLNMVISLLKFTCTAMSTAVLTSASTSYKKMIEIETLINPLTPKGFPFDE